jgi:hypothetical protein
MGHSHIRSLFPDVESDDYNSSDPANGNVSYVEALADIHAVTSDGN